MSAAIHYFPEHKYMTADVDGYAVGSSETTVLAGFNASGYATGTIDIENTGADIISSVELYGSADNITFAPVQSYSISLAAAASTSVAFAAVHNYLKLTATAATVGTTADFHVTISARGAAFELPDPSGHDGQYLTNDGVSLSWAADDDSAYAPLAGATFSGNVQVDGDVGFYATAPIAQQDGYGSVSTVAAGSGATVHPNTTFSGDTGLKAYTVGDLVRALKLLGLIQS